MAAFDQIAAQARQVDRQWQLILERARYEAELARRRFVAVDPENRLVGRTLERDWKAKLAEVERLERESAARPATVDPAGGSRGARRDLGIGAGSAGAVACRDDDSCRSQTIARIFDQGCALSRGQTTTIEVSIRWQTEACTRARAFLVPQRSCDARRTDPVALARLRALATDTPTARSPRSSIRRGSAQVRDAGSRQNIVKQLRYTYSIHEWLSRGTGGVRRGISGGWALFREGRRGNCSM